MADLQWEKIPKEAKLKCMDKMLSYIRKHAEEDIFNKDNVRDVYSNCKLMGATDLFEFVQGYVKEA